MDGVNGGLREICLSAAGGARSAASLGRPKSRTAVARSGSLYPDRVDTLLKTAWGDYAERIAKLPPEPTIGSRMNVKLACFTMSFFNALLGRLRHIAVRRARSVHVSIAAARSVRCVWAEVRWRWTLKVL